MSTDGDTLDANSIVNPIGGTETNVPAILHPFTGTKIGNKFVLDLGNSGSVQYPVMISSFDLNGVSFSQSFTVSGIIETLYLTFTGSIQLVQIQIQDQTDFGLIFQDDNFYQGINFAVDYLAINMGIIAVSSRTFKLIINPFALSIPMSVSGFLGVR